MTISVDDCGTPRYVYQLQRVRDANALLRRALPDPSTLYFSLKANPHPDVVRTLVEAGCSTEVCSSGELDIALAAGSQDCLYGGPGKTDDEIAYALSRGVRRFSVESFQGLKAVDEAAGAAGVQAECLLRINADYGATGGLRMAGRASQFGFDADLITRNPELLRTSDAVAITGLHFFPLSCAADIVTLRDAFGVSVREAARLRDECGLELLEVDLGGGFAAPFARTGTLPDYASLRPVLEELLDDSLPGWRQGEPHISFESGRYLAATAGVLECAVTDVKQSRGRTFVVVESGINHLGGLSGLGRLLPSQVEVTTRALGGDVPRPLADYHQADVVGPLCTPLDVHARQVPLHGIRVGDVVEIPNVGAYGLTASLLAFLGRPVPAEIVLDGGELVSATALRLQRVAVPSKHRQDGDDSW